MKINTPITPTTAMPLQKRTLKPTPPPATATAIPTPTPHNQRSGASGWAAFFANNSDDHVDRAFGVVLINAVGFTLIGSVVLNQTIDWIKESLKKNDNNMQQYPMVRQVVSPRQRSGVDPYQLGKDIFAEIRTNSKGDLIPEAIKLALGKAAGAIDAAWAVAEIDPAEAKKLCLEGLKELGTASLTDVPPLQALAALLKLKAYTVLDKPKELRYREAFNALNAVNESMEELGVRGNSTIIFGQMRDKTVFAMKGTNGLGFNLNNADVKMEPFSVEDELTFPTGKFPKGLFDFDGNLLRNLGHFLGSKGTDSLWGWANRNLPMFTITQVSSTKLKPSWLKAWEKANPFEKIALLNPVVPILSIAADARITKPGITFKFEYNPNSIEAQVLSVLGFTSEEIRQQLSRFFPSLSFETTLPFQPISLDAIPNCAAEVAKQLKVSHYRQNE
jgi:hypothetical protein